MLVVDTSNEIAGGAAGWLVHRCPARVACSRSCQSPGCEAPAPMPPGCITRHHPGPRRRRQPAAPLHRPRAPHDGRQPAGAARCDDRGGAEPHAGRAGGGRDRQRGRGGAQAAGCLPARPGHTAALAPLQNPFCLPALLAGSSTASLAPQRATAARRCARCAPSRSAASWWWARRTAAAWASCCATQSWCRWWAA